ncbi:MAG: type II secretion system F family protein [Burkholderiaceae bacterium]
MSLSGISFPLWFFPVSLGLSITIVCLLVGRAMLKQPSRPVDFSGLEPDPAPWLWRAGWWGVQGLTPFCARLLPTSMQVRLSRQLREAGLELALTPAQFTAGRLLLVLLTALLVLVLLPAGHHSLWLTALPATAWVLPMVRLNEQIRRRRFRLIRDLPVMLDLISLAVQAGSTTPLAIAVAVERGPGGVMRDELARVMREIKAGRTRQESLRAMGERFELPGLRHAVAAMITAERQGADLSPVLRAQAGQRREERFLDAERRAMQAPVKLLLPLVAFIFPGTFLILLFPVVMQLIADGLFA